mgnify:CR=1 FL=1
MKKLILLITALVFGAQSTMATTVDDKVATRNAYNYNNSFIFVENGITFSVYPDGEFDFHIENRSRFSENSNFSNVSITYNSGYDYNAYLQYDDYGAVIQVENVPVFYDYYGRISNIGNIDIHYSNNRVASVGGLNVYYNQRGFYSHCNGYINSYNTGYVYRPYHRYFARPTVNFCLVNYRPYRTDYTPIRYSYYRPYSHNTRRSYARIGHRYNYNKNDYNRERIYRNDKRAVAYDYRSNRYRKSQYNSRDNRVDIYRKNNNNTGSRTTTRNSQHNRNTSNYRKGETTRNIKSSAQRTVVQSDVVRTPRSTTAYRKPVIHNNNRAITGTSRTQRTATNRAATPSRTYRSTNGTTRSSSYRATNSSPSRNNRKSTRTVRGSRR